MRLCWSAEDALALTSGPNLSSLQGGSVAIGVEF